MSGDSWVAKQKSLTQEQIYLSGLSDEFSVLIQELGTYHASLENWLADLQNLATPDKRNSAPEELLGLWISRGFFGINDFDPRTAVLNDLRETGQTALLTSKTLRQELSRYFQILSEIEELDSELRSIQFNLIDPFLVKYGDVGRFGLMGRDIPTIPNEDWQSSTLLAVPELQNLANLKMITMSYLDQEIIKLLEIARIILLMTKENETVSALTLFGPQNSA